MVGFSFLDAYTVRARFFPAIIAGAPAIALAAILVSWDKLGLPHLIASGTLVIILFVLSDVARRRGKAIEPRLIDVMGGLPSTTMQRYRDPTLDPGTKARIHKFVGGKLGAKPPTHADEQQDPGAADAFYTRCGTWLREHSRDVKKFKILFDENITYGFRRNLLGLRSPALILNLGIFLTCLALLWLRLPINFDDDLTAKLLSVLVIALVHAVYIAFFVTQSGVLEAARQYGRQLLLSCETLQVSNASRKVTAA